MTGEADLRIVADTMPAAAVRCSRDQRFLWVNARYAKWIGRAAPDIVGRSLVDIIGEEALRVIQPSIDLVLQGEQAQYERLSRMPGLGERWLSWIYTPTRGARGEVNGWVAVGTDIHDRKLAEEALRQEYQKKDEFLAAVAHELRNPLAPMRNAVAILARKGPQDPEVAWSQSVIERQIDQLSRLIGDLVDLERLARGKLGLQRERVALEAVVDMALESSRPHVNAAGHRLSVLMPAEPAVIDGDAARLAHVFATLVKNAAKHTPPRGTISFSTAIERGEAVISVEDSGVGFEPAAAARLFEQAAGVGLRLAQGIVQLHGGRIEAQSAGRGSGAEFIVRLPLARGTPVGIADARAAARPRQVRVVVADDNRDAADSLQRILSLFGHEVRVAYDGPAAIRLAEEFRPRVAVLDIGMPGTNGYEVARALRERRIAPMTLVALTGWGQESDRRRAMEAGFDYHLTKPVDPEALNRLFADVAKDN
ncbi:MAG TPA: response regulator [Burkholderiales bacterium]|nr:response regulator [Burkholderiales bacterium]